MSFCNNFLFNLTAVGAVTQVHGVVILWRQKPTYVVIFAVVTGKWKKEIKKDTIFLVFFLNNILKVKEKLFQLFYPPSL